MRNNSGSFPGYFQYFRSRLRCHTAWVYNQWRSGGKTELPVEETAVFKMTRREFGDVVIPSAIAGALLAPLDLAAASESHRPSGV
jgi:hypothetical protein